jgi:hypothetical protein
VKAGCAALVWTPHQIRVLAGDGEFKLDRAIAPRDRFGLRLSSDSRKRLWLRIIDERQVYWISADKGASFAPVSSLPPAQAPISAYRYKLHPGSGVISALGQHVVWIYDPINSEWQPRELPSDIRVLDLSIDRQGGLWFAGSVGSQRIPNESTEAAVRYQRNAGAAFQARSPHLSFSGAVKVIKQGGLSELRTIDAEGEPVVATSLCSWLLDDSSSFVFTWDLERTFVARLKEEIVAHIDRSANSLRLFTYHGGVWEMRGHNWERHSITAAIERSLRVSGRKMVVRGVDVRQDRIAVAVEVSPAEAGDIAKDPEFTAVCLSTDNGKSFEVAHRMLFEAGEEINDAVWLE